MKPLTLLAAASVLFALPMLAKLDLQLMGMSPALDVTLRPALEDVADVPGLPRVLIIGDSISIGYTREVRQHLAGRANVHRPSVNCGPTVLGLQELDNWLGTGKWDVIYFNFGLHDLKYLDAKGTYIIPGPNDKPLASVEQYSANLRQIVTRLQRTGAHLIFATSAPVPDGTVGRIKDSELAYNAAVTSWLPAAGVTVDDLHAFIVAHPELRKPHDVHLKPEGNEVLGAHVAGTIASFLKP